MIFMQLLGALLLVAIFALGLWAAYKLITKRKGRN